jgi:molybdopterin synthase catalytic subunit
MFIKVQQQDFDLAFVEQYFANKNQQAQIGAVVTFTGLVREFQHSPNDAEQVTALHLEHYPGMTEQALKDIAQQASERWLIDDLIIIHRIGTLKPTDNIVLVATASAHRQDAFDACQFIMDILKTSAPFWKKEITTEGERWVDAKMSDDDLAKRWK